MIGLDTNILVRAVMADDAEQVSRVTRLFHSLTLQRPGYITLVCLAEFVWVVQGRYRQPKNTTVQWLDRFLNTPELIFENQSAVEEALHRYASTKSDFADCLIERAGHVAGCASTVTFDKAAAKTAGMRLL